MKSPLVSVVLSVYNGAATLSRCLNSIAAQSYTPLEIIFIDDGSQDDTRSVLAQWHSKHNTIPLTILQNGSNQGLAPSLNRGINAARGKYIARIDADDLWLPEKITKQVAFLENHPDYGMVGSFYINERAGHQYHIRLPITDTEIKRHMFRKNPFGHSCVVLRRDLVLSVGGYNGQLREDRDLWFRLIPHTHLHNIPEFLVIRNISSSHFTSPKELRRNIRTVHTYIQKYRAPLWTYIWLLEPIAVFFYHTVKKICPPLKN